ncbi:MAG: tetratricopeptide repeat protein, partial [Chloroflexi bacterium]
WGILDSGQTTQRDSLRSSTDLVLSDKLPEIREKTEPPITLFLERLAPFVAREEELQKLNNYLNEALKGNGRVIFVAGEAGQGKTSLLGAFSRQVQEAHPDLITAGGNCNAYTGIGDPYLPFREIIEVFAGEPEANAASGVLHPDQPRRLEMLLPVVLQKLVETAPDLIGTIIPVQSLLHHASSGGPRLQALLDHLQSETHQHFSTNIQQSALIEQYTRMMQELSEHAPLLLILDDLQWADQGTANLLFNLGRRLRGHRIMILGAYRPDEVAVTRDGQPHPLSKVLYELQRDYGDLSIDLGKAEGRTFVNQLLDIESNCLGDDFRETLYQQTGGHPLFTTELLNEMRVRGDLVKDEDGCWVEGPSLDWEILPARVEGAIGERINRLDEPLVRLLETASFEGEEFTAEVVSQVMNLDVRETIRQLSSELDKKHKLVRALGSKRVGGKRLSRYRFQHILIQKYLYQRLDDVERVYQHERVASTLESFYEDELDEAAVQLAWQYEAAEIPEKAVIYLKMAGEQAQRAAALDEAALYYEAALKNWPKDDLSGRADLLNKLGICQWITSRLMDALKTFEEGFRIYQSLENWQGAGEIQRQIGRLYWEMGDREKSLYHYHQALSVLEMEPEGVELARAVSSISQMHMLAGEYDQALAWGERALALAQKLGAEDVILHSMNNMGSSYFETGNPSEGARLLQESYLRALELRLPYDVCRALVNLGEGWTGHGKYAEARKVFQELSKYAEMNHISVFAGSALVELGRIEWITGEWAASLNHRPMIHTWLERGQATAYLDITANVFFAMQMNDLGLHQPAYRMLERIHSVVKGFNEMQMTGPFMEQWAKALAGIGRLEEATKGLVELVNTIGEREFIIRQAVTPLLTALSWYETSPSEETVELSKRSLMILEQVHKQYNSVFTAAAFAEGQGFDQLREGEVKKALESYTKSADLWRSLDSVYYRARVLNRMGETLILTGKERDALTVYKEAYGILKRLGEQIQEQKLKISFLHTPFVQDLQRKIIASDQTS